MNYIQVTNENQKNGLCILAAAKKKPFLADPKFLTCKGFAVCDEADNGIQLWYLPLAENVPTPITTYALFYNGEYMTHEQMNDKRLLKLLEKEGRNKSEQ